MELYIHCPYTPPWRVWNRFTFFYSASYSVLPVIIIPPMPSIHLDPYMLLLSEGRAGRAWEPSNKAAPLLKSGAPEGKVISLY